MSTLSTLATILLALQSAPLPQEPRSKKEEPKTSTFFEYVNTAQGITFKMDNGRVELKVREDKGKGGGEDVSTYTADSMDAFKRLYPDIARKYDLEECLPKVLKLDAIGKGWNFWDQRCWRDEAERFRKDFDTIPKEVRDAFGTMDRWFDEEHQILRDLERRLHEEGGPRLDPPSPDHGTRFGIQVLLLGEPLRQQLRLKAHEGLIVSEVEKGSSAEASGVKKYDVLLKLSGQVIEDNGGFRDQLRTALQSQDFTLELIRGGSPLKLAVHPLHSS